MPYANIHWIKLRLEILSDYRFTDKLNDIEKLIFINLLLLAGDTNNNIPQDAGYIKRRLNLQLPIEDIDHSIKKIVEIYPKTIAEKGFIRFKNFEEYHNYTKGNPKEIQRKSKGNPKVALDKIRTDKKREDKNMASPSIETVSAYCKERNNGVDPKAFVNHYQAKGWMIGKNKMKDWQAAVRTWEKSDNKPKTRMIA